MEQALNIIATGNPLAIVALIAVIAFYFVIRYQRNNTAEVRDAQNAALKKELSDAKENIETLQEQNEAQACKIQELTLSKELMLKDISNLQEEQTGIKQDVKEIKQTLQSMALALERIAAKYDKD